MIFSENSINILATKTYKGIGRAWIVKNLKGNEQVKDIVSLLNRDQKNDYFVTIEDFEKIRESIRTNIQKLEGFADGVVALGDKNFPIYRGEVKNSEQPVVLFYQGNLSLLQTTNTNIAVVGLLNPDYDIEIIEKKVVTELVKKGVTILSGLALGCDSIAHRQTLGLNGKTIAVLPGPLNNVLPTANKELAKEIVKNNGLLITEYYENVNSKIELSGRYQERDRLQALFSSSIILSASYSKNDQGNDSGSRLALGYAKNYGIPRAVIYDPKSDLNNPKFDLNRQLIKEDKEVILIDQGNLDEVIDKIMLKKVDNKNNQPQNLSLFDSI